MNLDGGLDPPPPQGPPALSPCPPHPDGPRAGSPWSGLRTVPVPCRFPDGDIPAGSVVVSTDRGDFVICCPASGVPLTQAMAAAAGITLEALHAMVARERPLGVTREQWERIGHALGATVRDGSGSHPPLLGAALRVAVGGSAVACFSSQRTLQEKKRFPRNEYELEYAVKSSPRNVGLQAEELASRMETARRVYGALDLGERIPDAPWFGIMARLQIEDDADVDIQIHSALIDSTMLQRAQGDPTILERQRADRLGRWDLCDVAAAFPQLARLHAALRSEGISCDFEILGPGGDAEIARRTDWWPIDLDAVA